jgi:flagellar basal-body rod modification protein FlgD
MSGIQLNSLTAAGNAAATSIASALVPKKHAAVAAQSSVHANATTGGSGTATSTSATGQNITSADFLTLLVSELKNQDPTQPTDPNQYITQLAQVNSLQQLISINSGIGQLDSAIAPTATKGS